MNSEIPEKKLTKAEQRDMRDEESLRVAKMSMGISALSAAASVASAAATLGLVSVLNRKHKDVGERYLMSESMGLIRWR